MSHWSHRCPHHTLASLLLLALLVLPGLARHPVHHLHHGVERADTWDDVWLIHLTPDTHPQVFALEHGYEVIGEVRGFPGHFMLRKLDHDGEAEARHLTFALLDDLRVVWAEQQFWKQRVKRSRHSQELTIVDDKKSIPDELLKLWEEEETLDKPQMPKTRDEKFDDELWDHQWYLHDTRYLTDNLPDISLHVESVWSEGISGSGVRVVVIDDGIDYTHPDLAPNFSGDISYDFNGDDTDISPRDVTNSHGTRCAGEVAMVANNKLCGVGVAFNSTIGGIRMLDGKISDTIEGMALSFALDKVDIFSSSWGPTDDGATVEGPGKLASEALVKGVTEGRGGKGVIYVWASGNGGSHEDDCNCDGYTSSIYTLSGTLSSASQHGQATWYGESCPSTLTSTYSSGAYTDQKIATTDVGGGCTVSHTGTSAAAPLAAGILALVLEAAPGLTWRDVQHLVVRSSNPAPLFDNGGWEKNGAGLWYNPRFGFGIMDAEKIVNLARKWENVGEKTLCRVEGINHGRVSSRSLKGDIDDNEVYELTFPSDCDISLEHVQVLVTVEHPVRGQLEAVLVSPGGSRTRLLAPRPGDISEAGFRDWPLTSVMTWGEAGAGDWVLYIVSRGGPGLRWRVGDCFLHLHGVTAQREK